MKLVDSPMKRGNATIKLTEFLKNDSRWFYPLYPNGVLIPGKVHKSASELGVYLLDLSKSPGRED